MFRHITYIKIKVDKTKRTFPEFTIDSTQTVTYRAGKKKGTMLNWSSALNFWDMTTLILSKERIGPGKFFGIILKVRQLLVVSLMAQNQNCKKKICSFLYPRAFFWRVWYVPHIILTSNIYFGLTLLIPVILSYIAAGYDHFRPFYQNLKNGHF